MSKPKLGVGITTYNSANVLGPCLENLADLDAFFVLYDSNSDDGTVQLARQTRPDITILAGNKDAWWATATNAVIKTCLDEGCDYVLLLNPDVRLNTATVLRQLDIAASYRNKIIIPLLLNEASPGTVAYAGSRLRRVTSWCPATIGHYVVRPGSPLRNVPSVPYETNDMSARGVMIPREIFQRVGLLDDRHFPHYGADVDFSYRMRRLGYKTILVPELRGQLVVAETGIPDLRQLPFLERLTSLRHLLFDRKHGEMIRVQWHLQMRHQPFPFGFFLFPASISWQIWRHLCKR